MGVYLQKTTEGKGPAPMNTLWGEWWGCNSYAEANKRWPRAREPNTPASPPNAGGTMY